MTKSTVVSSYEGRTICAYIRLREGKAVPAVEVEYLPDGWLRAVTITTRWEYDDEWAYRVPSGFVTRRFPKAAVREVIEVPEGT